jgi:hypothetical protein
MLCCVKKKSQLIVSSFQLLTVTVHALTWRDSNLLRSSNHTFQVNELLTQELNKNVYGMNK